MKGDIIDELAETIWEHGNDLAGQGDWTYDDLDDESRARYRRDIIDAAIRRRGDPVADAIITAAGDEAIR